MVMVPEITGANDLSGQSAALRLISRKALMTTTKLNAALAQNKRPAQNALAFGKRF
jgi:hypothetical protein